MTTDPNIVCANCCFWNPAASTYGQCRRHAPIAREVETSQTFSGKGFLPEWPMTNRVEWCGDFVTNTVLEIPEKRS